MRFAFEDHIVDTDLASASWEENPDPEIRKEARRLVAECGALKTGSALLDRHLDSQTLYRSSPLNTSADGGFQYYLITFTSHDFFGDEHTQFTPISDRAAGLWMEAHRLTVPRDLAKSIAVLMVPDAHLRAAERMIQGCEACDADAEFPFDWLLDYVTAADPERSDYLMERPAKCRWCGGAINEKTLVAWSDEECE